jgi:hypothetical protein
LEICEEIERSMVSFEAKLHALASPAVDHTVVPARHANGHDPTAS